MSLSSFYLAITLVMHSLAALSAGTIYRRKFGGVAAIRSYNIKCICWMISYISQSSFQRSHRFHRDRMSLESLIDKLLFNFGKIIGFIGIIVIGWRIFWNCFRIHWWSLTCPSMSTVGTFFLHMCAYHLLCQYTHNPFYRDLCVSCLVATLWKSSFCDPFYCVIWCGVNTCLRNHELFRTASLGY